MNKIKGIISKLGTKGKLAVSSAVAVGTTALATAPTAFAAELGDAAGSEGGVSMWEKIATGVSSFIDNVMTPVGSAVAENDVVLAMLSVTFVMFGIRAIGRAVRSFGRGR